MPGYVQEYSDALKTINEAKQEMGGQKWDTDSAFRENIKISQNLGLSGSAAMEHASRMTQAEVVANYHIEQGYQHQQSQGQRIG